MLGYKSPGQAVGKGGSIIGHRHLQVLKTVSPLLALRMSVSLLAWKLPKPQENPGEAAISEQFPTSWDAEVTQDQTTTNLHAHRHCLDALPGAVECQVSLWSVWCEVHIVTLCGYPTYAREF